MLAGAALNIVFPGAFSVGGPPPWLQAVSAVVLTVGVAVWAWSVLLILTKVRAGELVTTGPYSLVKHPLYTSVALLVLPWLGFLLDTWLGAVIRIALYAASRLFAPAEEAELVGRFGAEWDAYCHALRSRGCDRRTVADERRQNTLPGHHAQGTATHQPTPHGHRRKPAPAGRGTAFRHCRRAGGYFSLAAT